MPNDRDNFKAGLLVLAGTGLALLVIFLLSDLEALFQPRQTLQVRYALSDGVRGLRAGAAVTLGDQSVGTVTAIEDQFDPQGPPGRVIGKLVSVEIPERYAIARNAVVELVVPNIGSGTTLNIRSVGEGEPYTPGQPLQGGLAPNPLTESLVRDMGIGDQQRAQIAAIIGRVDSITQTADATMPAVRQALEQAPALMDQAQGMVGELHLAAADVRQVTGQVRGEMDAWLADIEAVLTGSAQVVARVRDLIQDKEPAVRQTLDNVQAITQAVREVHLAQVTEGLAKADRTLLHLEESSDELRTLMVGQRPVLERVLANAQLTSSQLKLAALEIRRSPWRLLYKPTEEEVAHDNLYDAARSFALAASAVDSAAGALRAVNADRNPQGPAVNQMVGDLERLLGEFEKAEARFWQALRDSGASRP